MFRHLAVTRSIIARRCLSSASSRSTSTSTSNDSLQYLIGLPPGKWSRDDWATALAAMATTTTSTQQQPWALMDRLVAEERQNKRDATLFQRDVRPAKDTLQSTVLRQLVLQWYESPTSAGRGGPSPERMFQKLQDYRRLGYEPDAASYAMVMAKAGKNDAGHRRAMILSMMNDGPVPDAQTCHLALQSMADPVEADQLLEFMKTHELCHLGTYKHVVVLWTRQQSGGTQRVRELLAECNTRDLYHMILEHPGVNTDLKAQLLHDMEHGGNTVQPNAASYGLLMDAYLMKGQTDKAEALLLQHADQVEPTHFHTMIRHYSKQLQAKKAESLLRQFMELSLHHPHLQPAPTVQMAQLVFNALVKTASTSEDGRLAKALLDHLWTHVLRRDGGDRPTRSLYNCVLFCYAKAKSSMHMCQEAEQILDEMKERSIVPDSATYNALLEGWANSRTAVGCDMAQAVLDGMASAGVKPDLLSYNITMGAWVKSGRDDAATKVELLVQALKEADDLAPDEVSYSSLMTCYARTNNPEKATDLFNQLCDTYLAGTSTLVPRLRDCNVVLSAWSSSNRKEMVKQALAVRDRVNRQKHLFHWKPEVHYYTLLITIWSKSNDRRALEHAYDILREMKASTPEAHPNLITYTSVLNCIAASNHEDKAIQALKLLLEMEERGLKPDLYTLNSILRVCATSTRRETAYKVAFPIFRRICKDLVASADTFIHFFDAAVGMRQDADVIKAHQLCCKLGLDEDPEIRKRTDTNFPHLILRRRDLK
jgi:pentatricopeptide repeat protein